MYCMHACFNLHMYSGSCSIVRISLSNEVLFTVKPLANHYRTVPQISFTECKLCNLAPG